MTAKFAFVISVDELSPLCLPCYGHRGHYTPELDRLASRGRVYHEHHACGLELAQTWAEWHMGHLGPIPRELPTSSHGESWRELGVAADVRETRLDEIPVYPPLPTEGAYLRWVLLRREGLSDESLLDWLEQYLAGQRAQLEHLSGRSGTERPEVLWILTSARGCIPKWNDPAPSPLHSVVAGSLSGQLWTPLILTGAPRTPEYGSRHVNLSTSLDVHVTLREWFGLPEISATGTEACSLLTEGEPPKRQLLLMAGDLVGWRSAEDLLVVSQSEFADPPESQPLQPRLYYKPEDRFDVNDMSGNNQQKTAARWEQLQSAMIRQRILRSGQNAPR